MSTDNRENLKAYLKWSMCTAQLYNDDLYRIATIGDALSLISKLKPLSGCTEEQTYIIFRSALDAFLGLPFANNSLGYIAYILMNDDLHVPPSCPASELVRFIYRAWSHLPAAASV